MDIFGVQIFDLAGTLFSRLVGRPLQRLRARWLARKGKVTCVLYNPRDEDALPSRMLSGAARLSTGRLQLWSADLYVRDVERPGRTGPDEARGDGDLWFRPATRIFTLHTHRGTMDWAVLDWQADWALEQLGLEPPGLDA